MRRWSWLGHSRIRHSPLLLCLLCAVTFATPGVARAQADRLDPHILIDALAEEGMSELLLHMIETEPPDDPVAARQVEIAQHRMRYRDTTRDLSERREALREALEATRAGIEDFRDHHQRPIWQTDLAELRLIEQLQVLHEQAALFHEFGVPTPEQREAYGSAAVEALEATSDATLRLFQLRGDIARDEERARRLRYSGMFTRLFEEYEEQRTPFFLAHAAYAVALLPDEHEYFADIANAGNPGIVDQRDTPEQERQRLLAQTIDKLEPFVEDAVDAPGAAAMAMVLTGRALVRQGRVSEGLEILERSETEAAGGRTEVIARLGQAFALHEQGNDEAALAVTDELAEHALVREQPLFRLLVTDAAHRIRMARVEPLSGEERVAAIAEAYQPYMTLLEDPSIERHGEALRRYVYRRWERTITDDEDLATRPAVVRLGIAQMARLEGQRQIQQARRDDREPPEAALDRLRRAVRLCEALRDDEQASESVRASAMFNEAVAQYWLAPTRVGNRLAAAEVFTDLAARFEDHARAEEAIANAVSMLRALHRMDGRPNEVERAYERAGEVLFERFAATEAAANERLYYAFNILQAQGRHKAAAEMYARIPRDHGDYFEAQRERLYALRSLHQQAVEAAEREAAEQARGELVEAAERLREEAEAALEAGQRVDRARRAAAGARLALADLAVGAGDTERALALLADFEQTYEAEADLIREALEQRILALIEAGQQAQQRAREAAAQADRRSHTEQAESFMAEAVEQAETMMARFPDDAAAVIDEVLTELEQRIAQQRAEAAEAVQREAEHLREAADQLASVAARLAETLVAWAEAQDFGDEQMLGFRLIQAKSLRLAGEADEAAAVLEPLMQRFEQDAGLINEYAETLFAQGGEQNLLRAARHYDRLITSLQRPYPDYWWNAWMRRLQINDRLDRATDTIAMRVRQLRQTDPELGGPPYRQALEQLESRHQR